MNELMNADWLDIYVIPWAVRIAMALAIFFVGKWIARIATNVARRLMSEADMDQMLTKFLANITYGVLLVAVVLAALDSMGLNITSLLAVLGAAGLAGEGTAARGALGSGDRQRRARTLRGAQIFPGTGASGRAPLRLVHGADRPRGRGDVD